MDFASLIPVAGMMTGLGFVWIGYKYLEMKTLGRQSAEAAAQERTEKMALQARLAVLERIVSDRGIETADQIEALRDRDRIRSEATG